MENVCIVINYKINFQNKLGEFCEGDINECQISGVCQNEAMCENTFGSYMCWCISGFQGHHCETDCQQGTNINKIYTHSQFVQYVGRRVTEFLSPISYIQNLSSSISVTKYI